MLKDTEDKEDRSPTPIDYDHVQLILKEAQKYSLESEVKKTAKKYIDEGYGYLNAFQTSFEEWVK